MRPFQVKIMQDGRDGDEDIGYIGNITDGAAAGSSISPVRALAGYPLPQGLAVCETAEQPNSQINESSRSAELPKGVSFREMPI